jgi:hypothetical protein
MMEKSAQSGEGGGEHMHPPPFIISTITYLWCALQLRGQICTPPISTLPLYVPCGTEVHCTVYTVQPTPLQTYCIMSLHKPADNRMNVNVGRLIRQRPILLFASPWKAGRNCTLCTVTTTTSQKKLYKGMECVCRRKARKGWLQGTHTV